MSKSTYSFQIDDNIKTQFDDLCASIGTSAETAFIFFAETAVRDNKIPVEIKKSRKETLEEFGKIFYEIRRQAKENGTMGISLEEINEEIRKARYGED